jgi:hypothetical protein
MKTNAIRFASGIGLFAFGFAFPAHAQVFGNYPVIIVPPPAQNYVLPKPAPRPPPPDRPKPTDAPAPATSAAPAPAGRYQGRTFVPD